MCCLCFFLFLAQGFLLSIVGTLWADTEANPSLGRGSLLLVLPSWFPLVFSQRLGKSDMIWHTFHTTRCYSLHLVLLLHVSQTGKQELNDIRGSIARCMVSHLQCSSEGRESVGQGRGQGRAWWKGEGPGEVWGRWCSASALGLRSGSPRRASVDGGLPRRAI